jgi:hypothetical protein
MVSWMSSSFTLMETYGLLFPTILPMAVSTSLSKLKEFLSELARRENVAIRVYEEIEQVANKIRKIEGVIGVEPQSTTP